MNIANVFIQLRQLCMLQSIFQNKSHTAQLFSAEFPVYNIYTNVAFNSRSNTAVQLFCISAKPFRPRVSEGHVTCAAAPVWHWHLPGVVLPTGWTKKFVWRSMQCYRDRHALEKIQKYLVCSLDRLFARLVRCSNSLNRAKLNAIDLAILLYQAPIATCKHSMYVRTGCAS